MPGRGRIGSERPGRGFCGGGDGLCLGREEPHGRSVGRVRVSSMTTDAPQTALRCPRDACPACAGNHRNPQRRSTQWNPSIPQGVAAVRAESGELIAVLRRDFGHQPGARRRVERHRGRAPHPGDARARGRPAGRRRDGGRTGRQPGTVGDPGPHHRDAAVDRRCDRPDRSRPRRLPGPRRRRLERLEWVERLRQRQQQRAVDAVRRPDSHAGLRDPRSSHDAAPGAASIGS